MERQNAWWPFWAVILVIFLLALAVACYSFGSGIALPAGGDVSINVFSDPVVSEGGGIAAGAGSTVVTSPDQVPAADAGAPAASGWGGLLFLVLVLIPSAAALFYVFRRLGQASAERRFEERRASMIEQHNRIISMGQPIREQQQLEAPYYDDDDDDLYIDYIEH